MIPNPTRLLGKVPPHPVLLPEGRRNARIIAERGSSVLSPLGERDRVRGDFPVALQIIPECA